MTGKYGIPYFANFINSDMSPEDARSMCCRLRLDNRELRKRGGGLFGANPMTGSIGVVTINLPKIAYVCKGDEYKFFVELENLLVLAKISLQVKRKVLERFTDEGLYPYARHYLGSVKKGKGEYWANHFNTIGIIGMHEACINLETGYEGIDTLTGRGFAHKVLKFIRKKLVEFQEEDGHLYNLEATPAEGTTYRLAKLDKEKYPDIVTSGEDKPYYTNSTHLPVGYTGDIFEALEHQDDLQTMYTGGTVLHGFLGEKLHDFKVCKELVRKVAENFSLPYFTITPTFSICPDHGYIAGEHFTCPYEK
jgi:ribonucleoside-triphosphate reductase